MKYIHWTETQNLESIAENGLEPNECAVNGAYGVHVWTSDQDGCEAAEQFLRGTRGMMDLVALVVELDPDDLQDDPAAEKGLSDCPPEVAKVYPGRIAPEKIFIDESSADELDEIPENLDVHVW